MNQRHPSHRNTGIMSLPAGHGVQRFQSGGGVWETIFTTVRGLISDVVPHIATSLVTVGLPSLLMGASPKDALKMAAATGIASLAGAKFSGATTPPAAAASQQQQQAVTPEEIVLLKEHERQKELEHLRFTITYKAALLNKESQEEIDSFNEPSLEVPVTKEKNDDNRLE